MKFTYLFAIILIFNLESCHNSTTRDPEKPETPKALENKNASLEYASKRWNGDLVESLYDELVSKNIDLTQLEEQIDALKNNQSDTTNDFDKFNQKNKSYLSSAESHINDIQDSALKTKMKALIASNRTNYNASILKHNELLKIIDNKNITIADLHQMLKIVKTLPLIENYQKDNLPSIKPIERYVNSQNKTIKLLDSLAK